MSYASDIGLSRRERERLDRRTAMLEAALAVFAENGYEQATIDQVAERAEFGKGTLYNYFPGGKEAILVALFEEMYEGLHSAITQHLASENGREAETREVFRGLVARLVGHFAQNRDAFLLLMKEAHRLMLGQDSEVVGWLMAKRDAVIGEMVPAIEAAMAAGHIKKYPSRAVAHVLMGNVQGYLMYAFSATACGLSPEEVWPPIDQAADFITEILFDGLLTQQC
jgi:TetR/AcrR family transcriptional regulator, repressor of fatR-cypB operon